MAGLRNTSQTSRNAPPANQSSTRAARRSVAHEESTALLAVHGLVERQLADAVDLDRRQRQVAALARGPRQPRDRNPAEPRPQLVVLGPQLVGHALGRGLAVGPHLAELGGELGLGLRKLGPQALSVGGELVALAGEVAALGIDGLDELHDLKLVVFELPDAPPDGGDVVLERLELARVADRTRVELLLGL